MSKLAVFMCVVFWATAVCGDDFEALPQPFQEMILQHKIDILKLRTKFMFFHDDMWDRATNAIERIEQDENEACKGVLATIEDSSKKRSQARLDDTSDCAKLADNANSLGKNLSEIVSNGIADNMKPLFSSRENLTIAGDDIYASFPALARKVDECVANMTSTTSYYELSVWAGRILNQAKMNYDSMVPPAMSKIDNEVKFLESIASYSPYCSNRTEVDTALNAYSSAIGNLEKCIQREINATTSSNTDPAPTAAEEITSTTNRVSGHEISS